MTTSGVNLPRGIAETTPRAEEVPLVDLGPEFTYVDSGLKAHPICGHCGKPVNHSGGTASWNGSPVCNPYPNKGDINCYKLIRDFHHDMPCFPCMRMGYAVTISHDDDDPKDEYE